MAGRTDAWILGDAAAAHGISRRRRRPSRRFQQAYLRHLAIELDKPGSRARG